MPDPPESALIKKLGFKDGARVTLLNAPAGFREELGALPKGVKLIGVQSPLDLILFFPESREELDNKFAKLAAKLAPTGALWVAWPKQAAGVETDLSFDLVQQIGLGAGLVDNKVCAINEVWSALRFVVRRADRG